MAIAPQNKQISSMSKLEMEEKIKSYKYVLFKLHKEIEEKDAEITRLTVLLSKAQQQTGK
jgi:hypothetical protein